MAQQILPRLFSFGLAAMTLNMVSVSQAASLDDKEFGTEINNPQQVLRTWVWDGTEPEPANSEVMFGAETDPWQITLKTTLTEEQRLTIVVEVITVGRRDSVVFQEEMVDLDPNQDQKFGFFHRKSKVRMSVHYLYRGNADAPQGEITVLAVKPVSLKKE